MGSVEASSRKSYIHPPRDWKMIKEPGVALFAPGMEGRIQCLRRDPSIRVEAFVGFETIGYRCGDEVGVLNVSIFVVELVLMESQEDLNMTKLNAINNHEKP